jgi:hypothetical protein
MRIPLTLVCIVCTCAACIASPDQAICGEATSANQTESVGSLAQASWSQASTKSSLAMALGIFARLIQRGACSEFVIPFEFTDRPTIDVAINGESRPLLFDTGTNTCLLRLSKAWPEPARLAWSSDDETLATLEGKRLSQADGGVLRYAQAALVRLGGVRLRDVAWRVYASSGETKADYAGAFAPGLLREWLIEVNNSAGEIRLHGRRGWLPQPGALMLPLVTLPRGLFVPLTIGGRQYWFHFDTGFSGGIGVAPEVLTQHADQIVPAPGSNEEYLGWHKEYAYTGVVVKTLGLPAYPGLSWAGSEPLVLHGVEGIAYRDAYRELAGYGVGGIAGSGFWQRFDYVLDYELGRLYLWPRDDWQQDAGAETGTENVGAGLE